MMTVSWRRVPERSGYNVRWGVEAGPFESVLPGVRRRGGTRLDVRALSVGVEYHVAVEAFDENGVSALSKVVSVH